MKRFSPVPPPRTTRSSSMATPTLLTETQMYLSLALILILFPTQKTMRTSTQRDRLEMTEQDPTFHSDNLYLLGFKSWHNKMWNMFSV